MFTVLLPILLNVQGVAAKPINLLMVISPMSTKNCLVVEDSI